MDSFESSTNGLATGSFQLLRVLYQGSMQDITTLLGGGNSSLTGQAPIDVTGGTISLGPSTGLELIDTQTGQTTVLTAQNGGIFLGALQFVSLYYLLNNFAPTKQDT